MDRYARLAVVVGTNLQPGQDLVVQAQVEHAPLARRIARTAYAAGARHVTVAYQDVQVLRAQVELGPEEGLGWAPTWAVELLEEAMRRQSALISISGDPEPDVMTGLDGGRLARSVPQAVRRASVRGVNERLFAWS